jgi:hypothetical protein
MTKEEAITLLCEHFSEGLVRTIVDAITEKEREECAKICDELSKRYFWDDGYSVECAESIRAKGE